MIRAVIVDDEQYGRENLRNLLGRYCPEVEVVGEADSVERGVQVLRDPDLKPDVAFLDINLQDGLVFQLLNELTDRPFEVIFVTAYEQFAVKAFKYSAIDYVLKPIDPDALKEAVAQIRPGRLNRIAQRLDVFQGALAQPHTYEKLTVSALDGIYFLNLKEIVRFEADDNYTNIYLQDGGKLTASKTIKSYEDLLANQHFFRVHKRHMINLNFIRKFVKGDGGYLVMDDGKQIDVSRRRRTEFIERVRKLQEEL
ncbi:MAG: LytTR family DNA-binding domain-containing protein [Saprospiraceae bacterium]|mgnify:CR=1 FL=1|nr:response regulator transcription factor [Saprospiraceae bacterium]MCB9311264.1 response regulator transcription factor [Lewinellaceae bacterium]HRW74592.1 LytTR family DNA-binding domain-containing protein [Saprospiraceae bacterium]